MEYCGIVDVVIDRDSYVNNSFIFYYIIGKRVKMGDYGFLYWYMYNNFQGV